MSAPIPSVARVLNTAREALDTLDLAITNVIDLSMENIDYGNTELNGKVMETLHRLRLSQLALEKALEAAE